MTWILPKPVVYSLSLSYWAFSATFGKTGHSLFLETRLWASVNSLSWCPLFLFPFLPSWQSLPQMPICVIFYKHLLNRISIPPVVSSYVLGDIQTLSPVCVLTLPSLPNHWGSRKPTLLVIYYNLATLASCYSVDSPGVFRIVVPSSWNAFFTTFNCLTPLYLDLS